jgi:Na+/proline symporter/nitrogen-specific signal transduction histidine kinase
MSPFARASAVWLTAFAYLGLLFAIAFYADRRADRGRSVIANPYIYALSLSVYATSWTFYGSVGRAAQSGVEFLPIYLGPTLVATVGWLVLRKMIRISKGNRITSVADFIAWRYGKNGALAALVTIVAAVGVMPYIALQLKAVASSVGIMLAAAPVAARDPGLTSITTDTAFYVALLLAAFSILFGTRHLDATERHEGMVAAVAFESLVKLAAFLAVGVFVTYGMYDGFADIFSRAAAVPGLHRLLTLNPVVGGYEGWGSLVGVSMLAFLCLPRQFQMAVVENVRESHVRRATWLFPLYMLLINIFVLPIAFGGMMRFPIGSVDADNFVLTLPLAEGHLALAFLVFIGGLSACTGMIIVETLALSIMICNDLVMPMLLRSRSLNLHRHADLSGLVLGIRRVAIVLLLFLGYAYYRATGESHALSAIGLVSFTAVAQFAPAMLIGMYWKQGTAKGAIVGLVLGFVVWVYTMLLPSFAESGWLSQDFIDHGPFGLALLRPRALFGLVNTDATTQAIFWSLFSNVIGYVGVSLMSRPGPREQAQALLFVDAVRVAGKGASLWRGSASTEDLRVLSRRFIGVARADDAFSAYAASRGVAAIELLDADADFVHFVEALLAGAIGAASARVMVATVVREEPLRVDEVLSILDEASQVIAYSRQLEEKSQELERTGRDLKLANDRLRAIDRMKDDFLSTVSHELRTPLASIRALSEILLQGPEIDPGQRTHFLRVVVKETDRLTRLINQVLDLAKVKAGRMSWQLSDVNMTDVIEEAVASMRHVIDEQQIALELRLPAALRPVRADRDRMLQVVVNLLSNAIKFRDRQRGRIGVSLVEEASAIRVEVRDNGRGIRPEDRELVFDRFAQLSDPVDGKPEGSGLGLAISSRIVERFGGRMWVEGGQGEGARLVFTVPYTGSGDGLESEAELDPFPAAGEQPASANAA